MKDDAHYMRRALRLADKGRGHVSPNPLVGAVLVRRGQIVGAGAHLQVGGPHAEIHALQEAGVQARGATLYVTLEPCAHHGRTPPCTQALIAAGIERVVGAVEDPDPRVSGQGFGQLRDAGIKVEIGLLGAEAERRNAAFLKHRRSGRPLVILKLAQTLDGRIATANGDARWISGEKSRRHTHRQRSWVDAIAVGAGTVLADNPQLNVRHVKGPNPRPMVIDGRLRVSPEARVVAANNPILVTSSAAQSANFCDYGVEVWSFETADHLIDLRQVTARAGDHNLTSLLIEGGGQLAAAALRDRIVDQVMVFITPRLMGTGIAAIADLGIDFVEETIQLENVHLRHLERDILYTAEVKYPCSPV